VTTKEGVGGELIICSGRWRNLKCHRWLIFLWGERKNCQCLNGLEEKYFSCKSRTSASLPPESCRGFEVMRLGKRDISLSGAFYLQFGGWILWGAHMSTEGYEQKEIVQHKFLSP